MNKIKETEHHYIIPYWWVDTSACGYGVVLEEELIWHTENDDLATAVLVRDDNPGSELVKLIPQ